MWEIITSILYGIAAMFLIAAAMGIFILIVRFFEILFPLCILGLMCWYLGEFVKAMIS